MLDGVKRSTPAAAPLPDGRVLIAGGYDGADVAERRGAHHTLINGQERGKAVNVA